MRPLRLTLEGFASFREPTTVDFEDADYFVLVGPTGAGKSSLIDAMAFALYGCVPRYDDRRVVAPVISQGSVEARVGLDFALGSSTYRAVRVVRLTGRGKGATTKEARLERLSPSEEILAGDADGVTQEVERLLGLTFDHFTKCVVLPQGAFADFLHDKPRDRQELLVELLDLGVYGQVAGAAHAASTDAAGRATSLAAVLARPPLSDATPSAVETADARVVVLDAVRAAVEAAQPEVDRLRSELREAASVEAEAAARIAQLAVVRAPSGVEALARIVVDARSAYEAAEADAAVAEKETLVAEEALAALPTRSALEASASALGRAAALDERIAKGAGLVVELAAAEALAAGGAEAARAALIVATAEREAAIAADHAAALARHLVAGEPCPVCEQPVAVVPPGSPAPDLDAAEAALHRAGADATAADGALRAAAEKHAQSVALLSQVGAEREVALADVTWADAAEVASALGAVTAAEAALTSARSAERERRAAARTATKARDEAMAREAEARDGFDRARDPVAALGAPAPVRVDLAADWLALDSWARTRAGEEESARAAAASRQAAAQGALDRATASLMAACREAGVTTPGERIGEDVAAARSAAAARAESLRAAAAEAEAVRAEVAAAESEAQVARSLAQHLNASHFEKWLLDEALALLVEGATRVLGELSGGAYALTLDGSGAFAVVDHRNGDQVRSARTLSGGETFLASLALALALADRLSELAAGGAARLESVFLDEGFGSLDADTLDTVAAAMEALASGGRVVGLVTHVRELADRVPTRFEVTKGPRTSAVVRVEA